MTDQQFEEIYNGLRWIFRALILIAGMLFGMATCGVSAHGQTIGGPILRRDSTLRVYVGPVPSPADARVYLWLTPSTSPNATIGPPWDEVGEELITYPVPRVRVVADDDLCRVDPQATCRDTGWADLPVPVRKVQIGSGGMWVDDQWIRLTVYVADVSGCAVRACGARLVVARMRLSDVLVLPVASVRRRAVAP